MNLRECILKYGIENIRLIAMDEINLGNCSVWNTGDIVSIQQYCWDSDFQYKVYVESKLSQHYNTKGHSFYIWDLDKFIEDGVFEIIVINNNT